MVSLLLFNRSALPREVLLRCLWVRRCTRWSCFEELPWIVRKRSEKLRCWDHLYVRAVDLQELRIRGIHHIDTHTLSDVFLSQKARSSTLSLQQPRAMAGWTLQEGQPHSCDDTRPSLLCPFYETPCPQHQGGGRWCVCLCVCCAL